MNKIMEKLRVYIISRKWFLKLFLTLWIYVWMRFWNGVLQFLYFIAFIGFFYNTIEKHEDRIKDFIKRITWHKMIHEALRVKLKKLK